MALIPSCCPSETWQEGKKAQRFIPAPASIFLFFFPTLLFAAFLRAFFFHISPFSHIRSLTFQFSLGLSVTPACSRSFFVALSHLVVSLFLALSLSHSFFSCFFSVLLFLFQLPPTLCTRSYSPFSCLSPIYLFSFSHSLTLPLSHSSSDMTVTLSVSISFIFTSSPLFSQTLPTHLFSSSFSWFLSQRLYPFVLSPSSPIQQLSLSLSCPLSLPFLSYLLPISLLLTLPLISIRFLPYFFTLSHNLFFSIFFSSLSRCLFSRFVLHLYVVSVVPPACSHLISALSWSALIHMVISGHHPLPLPSPPSGSPVGAAAGRGPRAKSPSETHGRGGAPPPPPPPPAAVR